MESAPKASGCSAAGSGGHTHTHSLSLSLSPTNGTVVDSNCRKFLRFSEGPDLRGNDTFCVGALLLPTAALVITNSGA